ncbi:MAG TPA: sigma-70 family RNA polymerase sigma factor [Thermoanaerobaculia bacterium]|nr:sigma-70 family RNA polymerase sigma factor [Thermoanaerobaculia bacterium]
MSNVSDSDLYLVRKEEELDRIAVERCLEGDPDAFGELIARYQKPVFNTVLRMVGDAEDAREVCQQAFMKAYEHLASYDRDRKFFSWMYRVAVNESINWIKARRPSEELDESLEHPQADPEEVAEDLDEWRDLHASILDLEPNYRAVIILRHFVHFTYEEIAEILKLPEKTVKSRLFTARQLLREALEAKGHHE